MTLEMALQVGTGSARLSCVFREHVGETLDRYLLEEQLRAVQRLLEGSASRLGRIAEKTSFSMSGIWQKHFASGSA